MPYLGAYYTWSNKTVCRRIDRVLINGYWHDPFDYTHAKFTANGLSDHSPIIIQFLQTSKPRHSFQYCDMWSHHSTYQGLISQALAQVKGSNYFQQMQALLAALRPLLNKLNRDKFGDLQAQQEKTRQKLVELQESLFATPRDPLLLQQEHELRLHYSDIISSSLSLMRQQSKMD